MAELDTSGGGGKGKKVRSKKASTRVDLTAMVDLAFLLITFFMMTTTLSKPKAMDVAMPDKDEKQEQQLDVAASRTMTILLGKDNKVAWYMGEMGKTPPTVEGFGKNGLRQSLLDKSKEVQEKFGKYMFVILKPSDKSVYKNMVDALDEIAITNIQSYGIVAITSSEIKLLQDQKIY